LIIIAVSIAAGMIPVVAPTFFAQLPKWVAPLMGSGITLATVSAVLLNALFNGSPTQVVAGRGESDPGAQTTDASEGR
jgi:xanthine/uracil permease